MDPNDSTENPFDDDPQADEFGDDLREKIDALIGDDGEEDDAGLDAPFEDGDLPETVSPEEGAELASDARLKAKDAAKKVDAKTGKEDDAEASAAPEEKSQKPEDTDEKAKADLAEEDNAAEKGEKASDEAGDDLKAAAAADLLKDVPEAQRGEISRRLSEAETLLAPFQTEYAKAELARHGASPQDAIGRLVELNQFAQTKPDEYLAWVAREMKGDGAHEVLEGAAKHLGYKLVKDAGDGEDDDEIFLDEQTRALKKENEDLKRRLEGDGPSFGPDTPERRQQRDAQRTLQDFTTETDETGSLKRPYFNQLQPRIAAMAREHVEKTKAAVTTEDLARFYDAAMGEVRQMAGAPATSAAHDAQDVASKEKEAAAAEKAMRASKSVDGTGQGASRRPALPDDAPIEDVIRAQLAKFN